MAEDRIVRVRFEAVLNGLTQGVKRAAQDITGLGTAGRRASSQINFRPDAQEARDLGTALNRASRDAQHLGTTAQNASRRINFREGITSAKSLRDELFSVKNVITTIITAVAGKEALGFTIGAAFDEESTKLQYEVLLKSAEEAQARFDELYKMGAETPYEMEELIQADKVLTGFNIRTKDMLTLMGDVGAAMQDPKQAISELSRYMGQLSAGQTGEALARFEELGIVTRAQLKGMGLEFDKANSYVGDTGKLMEAVISVMEDRYSGMMGKLSKSGSGLMSTVMDTLKGMGRDIGNNALDEAKGSMEGFLQAVERAEQNGSLDRLTTKLGQFLAWIFTKLAGALNNLDYFLAGFDRFASFVERNSEDIIWAIKKFIQAFLLIKGISFVFGIISGFVGVVKTLKDVTWLAAGAQKAWNLIMKANPIIFIIGLVLGLIIHIITLKDELKNSADMGTYLVEELKLKFLQLGYIVWSVISFILEGLRSLLGDIPVIGDAINKMADLAKDALGGLGTEIDTAKTKLSNLRKEAETPVTMTIGVEYNITTAEQKELDGILTNQNELWDKLSKTPEGPERDKIRDQLANVTDNYWEKNSVVADRQRKDPRLNVKVPELETPEPSSSGYTNSYSSGGSSSSKSGADKKDPPTIDERISKLVGPQQVEIDLYESQSNLAEAKDDIPASKKYKQLIVDTMTIQARKLLGLMSQVKGADKNIVETARNKILTQIVEVTKEINETLGDMIGSFNIPSELTAMTKYQYEVKNSENNLTKHMVISPEIKMYLTIEDLKGKSIQQLQEEMKALAGATFNKNALVEMFMMDVTRN